MHARRNMIWLLSVILAVSVAGIPSQYGRNEGRNIELEEFVQSQTESLKSKMVHGIPEAGVPSLEPFHIKKLDFSLDKLGVHLDVAVSEININGMSGFTDHTVTATDKRIEIVFIVPNVEVTGQYNVNGYLNILPSLNVKGNGPIFGKVGVLTSKVIIDYEVNDDGVNIIQAKTDMDFEDVSLILKNLLPGSFFSQAVENYINSNAKSYLLELKNEPEWLMSEIMKKVFTDMLDKFFGFDGRVRQKRQLFACGTSNVNAMLDNVIANARPFIKSTADPFPLPIINETQYFILHDGKINGLSTIYRSGNSVLECDNDFLKAEAELSLRSVGGSYDWTATVPYINYKISGKVIILISNATADALVRQEKKVGANPVVEKLELNMKNVQVQFDGLGAFSLVLSQYATIAGNMFKDQITSWIEAPVKSAIQDQLNKISVPF